MWLSSYKFSKVFVSSMKWTIFGSFNALSLPNMAWFPLLKKQSVWRIFQNFEFFLKRDISKVYSFALFWALFNPGKSKILVKTKLSPKNTSSGLSNRISSKSQKNHRILMKLVKEPPVFGPKSGLSCPLALAQRVNTNSHIGYYKTIYP